MSTDNNFKEIRHQAATATAIRYSVLNQTIKSAFTAAAGVTYRHAKPAGPSGKVVSRVWHEPGLCIAC